MVNFVSKIFEYMLFEIVFIGFETFIQIVSIICCIQRILFGPKPTADETVVKEASDWIFEERRLIEHYFGMNVANIWAKRKERWLNKNGVPVRLHLED